MSYRARVPECKNGWLCTHDAYSTAQIWSAYEINKQNNSYAIKFFRVGGSHDCS